MRAYEFIIRVGAEDVVLFMKARNPIDAVYKLDQVASKVNERTHCGMKITDLSWVHARAEMCPMYSVTCHEVDERGEPLEDVFLCSEFGPC